MSGTAMASGRSYANNLLLAAHITMPAPQHSILYGLNTLPDANQQCQSTKSNTGRLVKQTQRNLLCYTQTRCGTREQLRTWRQDMVREVVWQVAVEWQRLHQYRRALLDPASDDQTGECTAGHRQNCTQQSRLTESYNSVVTKYPTVACTTMSA